MKKTTDLTYPIEVWYGIPAEFVSKDRFKEAAEAGINVMPINYTEKTNLRVLNWCHQLGIKCKVSDARFKNALTCPDDSWKGEVAQAVAAYKDCPALLDYHIKDEPIDEQFPRLAEITEYIRLLDPEHMAYINLLPLVAVGDATMEAYEKHVRNFVNTVKPGIVSYDHYNLMKARINGKIQGKKIALVSRECRAYNGTQSFVYESIDRPQFYENLEVIRNLSLEYKLPWMAVVLLVEHWNYRYLCEPQLRWESFAVLAYGGSRLSYFTYWTPDRKHNNEPWTYHHAMIESDGLKDAHYYMVKNILEDFKPIAQQLINASSTAVFHIGEEKDKVTPFTPFGTIEDIKGDSLLAGFFDNDMLLIVNKNMDSSQRVHIQTPSLLQYFHPSTGKWKKYSRNKEGVYTFSVEPGDGRLLRII